MTRAMTPASASRDITRTTPQEDHDMTADYYAEALAIVAGLLPEIDHQRQLKTARACHNGRKPKGPARRNVLSVEVAAPTVKRGFVMSEFVRFAPARAGMVYGHGGGYPQGRPHGYGRVSNHHAHPLRVETLRVVPKSPVGAMTMTQAYATLVRTAAPIISLARTAAPIQSPADTTDPQIIALHAAAENALASALHLLRATDCDPAKLQAATGRAIRAATALKRLSAAQVEGGAA